MKSNRSRTLSKFVDEALFVRFINEYDIIPFITMRFLSEKQEENLENVSHFEKQYGFIFRDYELISNIIEKYEKDDKTYISDFKSAVNALKNSKNDTIKEIYSKISLEKITDKYYELIMDMISWDMSVKELYQEIIDEKYDDYHESSLFTSDFQKILSNLAGCNHKIVNVYNPLNKNAQTIISLDTFEHATIQVTDTDEYYNIIQDLLINEIELDKVTININEEYILDNQIKYDTIISIFPYLNHRIKKQELNKKYNTRNPSLMYLLNLIDHLDSNGLIVTVIPPETLVKKDYYKLRKTLVEENKLDAIIEFEQAFRRQQAIILIIDNNKKTDDYLFIKEEHFNFRRHNKKFEKIIECYQKREKLDKRVNIVDKELIVSNDYNLNPKRYIYLLDYEEVSADKIIKEQKLYSFELKKLNEDIGELINKLNNHE